MSLPCRGRLSRDSATGGAVPRRAVDIPPRRFAATLPLTGEGFLWILTDAVLANPDRRLGDQFALCARRHGLCADFRRLRRAESVPWRTDGGRRGRRLGGRQRFACRSLCGR